MDMSFGWCLCLLQIKNDEVTTPQAEKQGMILFVKTGFQVLQVLRHLCCVIRKIILL